MCVYVCLCMCVCMYVSMYLWVYMYVCVCASMYVCMYVCVSVGGRGGVCVHVCKPEDSLGIIRHCLPLFLRQALSLTQPSRLNCLISESQGSTYLRLPNNKITRAQHHTHPITCGFSCLQGKSCINSSISPSPLRNISLVTPKWEPLVSWGSLILLTFT